MMTRTGARLLAASVAVTLALAALLSRSPVGGDAALYARMAAHPSTFTAAPWGYRLLTPWLVHILPLPQSISFWLLTVVSLAGTATVLGLLCLEAGLHARSSYAAAVLFLLSYAATFDLVDWRLVDPLAYLGTALFFLLLARHRPMWAALMVLLVTLNKEWGLFLIPALLVYLWGHKAHRLPVLALGVLAPAVAYVAVRHWPGFSHADSYYSLAMVHRMLALNTPRLIPALCTALGALWLVAPLGWHRAPDALRRTAWIVPGVLVQLLAAQDTARMLAYAAPCVVPLAVAALDSLPWTRWAPTMGLLALSLVPTLPLGPVDPAGGASTTTLLLCVAVAAACLLTRPHTTRTYSPPRNYPMPEPGGWR